MTDTNFECNILNICKGYFFEPEEGLRWLNKFEEFVDSPFRRAFLEGARDYLCFINEIPYEPRLQYKLPELTHNPSYCFFSERDREELYEEAMPTWITYNVLTKGPNEVC